MATLAAFLIAPSGGGSSESDQAGFVQLAQQIPMVPGKYFESSALVGRNPRYLQNNCGKAGNSRLLTTSPVVPDEPSSSWKYGTAA